MVRPVLLLSLLLAALACSPRPEPPPTGDLPIFDTHIHYSADAWNLYSVDEALEVFEQAGIYCALVSSTPDDGALMLYERVPRRVVPILRPYRTRADMVGWTSDPMVLDYVEQRLQRGVYRGIGEFHLYRGEAARLVPSRLLELSSELGLILHAHADDVAVEELLRTSSSARVLWAHAGLGATPEQIERLLDTYPNLWVDLALRNDVAPGATLDSRWSALFQRYPDRFMVGTDTWTPSRWTNLPGLMAGVQVWLRQLPRGVAEQIAYGNAERLFGTP